MHLFTESGASSFSFLFSELETTTSSITSAFNATVTWVTQPPGEPQCAHCRGEKVCRKAKLQGHIPQKVCPPRSTVPCWAGDKRSARLPEASSNLLGCLR